MSPFYDYLRAALAPAGRWLALAGTLLAAPAALAQTLQTLPAAADSYVQGGTGKDNNFSAETRLNVKTGSTENVLRYTYLRFNAAPLTISKVGTAKLKVFCYKLEKPTVPTELTAYATHNKWQEASLTFATKPALGRSVGTSAGPSVVGSYLEIDVTKYVQSRLAADSAISFVLADALKSNNQNEFYSKEAAANPPVLELSDQVTVTPILTGTFYVDAVAGSDANTGLSETAAWQTLAKVSAGTYGPGSRLLFRAGQRFAGTLAPDGSGTAALPIVVDKYGSGERPALDGEGAPYTVRLNNQQFWEFNNLEITNYNAAEEAGLALAQWEANNKTQWADAVRPPQYVGNRTKKFGVLVTAQDQGAVRHLRFKNLNVHGINGYINQNQDDSKFNGGLFFDIGGTAVPTYFDDLLIEDCRIADVDRTGVSNRSSWATRTLTTGGNWTPSRNLVIRRNTFERIGANALIVRDSKNPLIEYNLFDHNGIKISGNAGFNFNTDGAVWQFNESRFTKANLDDTDAGGLDSDYKSKGTIIQYNYLHDNDYGLLVTGGPGGFNDSTVVRYNILERNGLQPQAGNDGKYQIKVSGSATRTYIHNNVFYTAAGEDGAKPMLHKQWTDWPDATVYTNNVFYLLGASPAYDLGSSTGNTFSHNLYYGAKALNQPVDAFAVTGDPKLVAPGTGPNGYKLQAGSAAIAKGQLVPTMPAKDYFQALIDPKNAIDIGVQQFSAQAPGTDPGAGLVTTKVFAMADAYVQGGADSGTNYGAEALLRVKNTPAAANQVRESFMRYDLSGIKGELVNVQLVVNGALNPKGPMPVSAFAVANDSWTETGITYDNRPARGRHLTTLPFTTIKSSRYAVDITEYAVREMKGDKRLSLALLDTTASTVLANITSKEGDAELQTYLQVTTRGTVTATASAASASIVVFPNPTRGRFTVQRPAGAATTATLLNSLGQVVRTVSLPAAETVVDVPGLPGGLYVLRLTTTGGQSVTKRIVLE